MNDSTIHMTDTQEPKALEKNAFRIAKPRKLKESIKTSLKNLGCRPDTLHGYLCPLDAKDKVLNLFNEYQIKADLIDTFDPSPGKDRKINSLEIQIDIVQKKNNER
jgi:hypothetical protein